MQNLFMMQLTPLYPMLLNTQGAEREIKEVWFYNHNNKHKQPISERE
jgi:hypothetical protein